MSFLPPTWSPAGLAARLRSLWRGLRRRESIEAEMAEEFRHHIALRTDDLMASEGLTRKEAYRRARLEFGHVEGHREEARASRGLRWLDELGFSWLDVKLGLRMLKKYPGLSVISVVGMAVAIAIGAGAYTVLDVMLQRDVPLPEGERLVAIQNNTSNPGNPDRHLLHDLGVWREELRTLTDVGAFVPSRRNLITPDGQVTLEGVAMMSASGFRAARVPPLLGRTLVEADEEPGASQVLVIAYEEWQGRFGGDPGIIGSAVRLGGPTHTVVGVMPEGFRFPLVYRYWIPLAMEPANYAREEGPALYAFGRLAEGETLESARAELATLGARLAADYPETRDLRPTVLPYPYPFTEVDDPTMAWLLRGLRLMVGLLLVVVAVNVGLLVYARTTTRTGEIAVRGALGASRRRVVTQLFAEALVLSLLAAVIGLSVAAGGLALLRDMIQVSMSADELPFWMEWRLTPGAIAYTAALAVTAGVIVGVLPALRVTGKSLQAGLQKLGGRGSPVGMGRTWTLMIVLQVGLAVGILPYALVVTGHTTRHTAIDPGYPADEVLRARLTMPAQEAPTSDQEDAFLARYEQRYRAAIRGTIERLRADPAVAAVSVAHEFPGEASYRRFEVEGGGVTQWARSGAVAPDLFRVLDVPILAGRDLATADTLPGVHVALVDKVFAEKLFGGRSPVGRRVRELRPSEDRSGPPEPGPWVEVVGVVPAFTVPGAAEGREPNLFRAAGVAGATGRLQLVARIRNGRPSAFYGRLRGLAASVDPALQVYDLHTAAAVESGRRRSLIFFGSGVLAVTLSVLLLSGAGIYAMISFTVARRRKEIGIRTALGARPGRLLGAVLRRTGLQITAGIVAGLLVTMAIDRLAGGSILSGWNGFLLPSVAMLMATVGLIAALGPARRALAIQPTEALRDE